MNRVVPVISISLAMAASGALAMTLWLRGGATAAVEVRDPDGLRGVPKAADMPSPLQSVATIPGDGAPADLPGEWPQFRGPGRDAVSTETVRLARSWPVGGPRRLWSVDVGQGYAAAAVKDGRVYVLDYDHQREGDALRCLSLADGREIWRTWYPLVIKSPHGMSRTIPAVTDDLVVTFGPRGHVMCVDARTGRYRWGIDLARDFGAVVPSWNAGQCPLIDAGRIILAPCGEDLIVAVDSGAGKVVWRTPNDDGWKMTHSSIMPMTLAGKRMYVYCANRGVVGVSAEDGKVLWKTDRWPGRSVAANCPSPLILPHGRVFVCAGYGAGSAMLEVTARGEAFEVKVLYRLKARAFGTEQQTPVFHNGYIYGLREKGQLVCLDPRDGRIVWVGGQRGKFGRGLGPFMIAGGLLFVMGDHGTLTVVEPGPGGYRPLAEAKVLEGHGSWGPMALAGGRMIVRDFRKMVCLDLRAREAVEE